MENYQCTITNIFILGKIEKYELYLKQNLLSETIKTTRKEKNLTQEALGKLVGVQKAQISKLENGSTNVTIATILKIFDALKTKVKLQMEVLGDIEKLK